MNRPINRTTLIDIVSWLIRELTGLVFIFSGFVKAVDPWGTLYKFSEYFAVWGFHINHNLILAGVVALCAFEFLVGVFLVFGAYRRSTPIAALLFMCLMLPLTFWLAFENPIKDCGCFGDAVILTNWQTFWKNVILTLCIIFLIKFNRTIPCVITPAFQWILFTASTIYIFIISWCGYNIQPMLDFRPYKVGYNLSVNSNEDTSEPSFIFTYQKDGIKQEFSEDDELPDEDSGWVFVERKEIYNDNVNNENSPETTEFRFWDREGREDVTEEALGSKDKILLLLIPSLKDISASTTWKINALNEWAKKHNITMEAVIALHSGDMEEWEDLSMPAYEIFTAEDTSIKEFARGNPAVAYIENGTIRWKTSLQALDDSQFESPDNNANIIEWAPNEWNLLRNLSLIYIAVIGFLVAVSFIPTFASIFTVKRKD